MEIYQSLRPSLLPFLPYLARTSSTVLNRSHENGHLCLIPNLRGKAFSLLPFSLMLAPGFQKCPLSCWGSSLLFLSWVLSSYNTIGFVKCLFHINQDDSMSFFLHFMNVVCYVDWLLYTKPALNSWAKSHLGMVYSPFNMLLDLVC